MKNRIVAKNVSALEEELLLSSRLFQGVEPADLQGFLAGCDKLSLESGEVLLSPDNSNDRLFVALDGRLSIHLHHVDNNPFTYFGPGECVGELSVFDQRYPSAWVQAAEPCTLLSIAQGQLWEMIDHVNGVARNLLHILSGRLRSGNTAISALEVHANIDPLTGMHNRRWMDDMFNRAVHRAEIDSSPLCLFMVDVDFFKQYNDTYGHLAGDHALRAVAKTMQNTLRSSDMLARFGGEEFIVLLVDTHLERALEIGERLRVAIGETQPFQAEGDKAPPVTVSIGVAERDSDATLESIVVRADEALYRAKENGRDQVCPRPGSGPAASCPR